MLKTHKLRLSGSFFQPVLVACQATVKARSRAAHLPLRLLPPLGLCVEGSACELSGGVPGSNPGQGANTDASEYQKSENLYHTISHGPFFPLRRKDF